MTQLCREDGDFVEPVGNAPTMQFDADQASGFTGVNRWFAPYTHIGSDLCFGQVGMTMMAGPEDLMEQEQEFLDVLNRSDSYAIAGETLEIREGEEIIALFTAVPSTIEGDWELQALNNARGGVVSIMDATAITAHFEGGIVSGSSGCNRFRAPFEADGSRLHLGPAMGTRTPRAEPEGALDQEQQFLSLFDLARSYQIVDGTQLTILDEAGARLMEFRRVGD